MVSVLLVSLTSGKRKVAYLIVRGVPDHKVKAEPARLKISREGAYYVLELSFVSGDHLRIVVEDQDSVLEECSDVLIDLVTSSGRSLRFKSCYKMGDQWYIDYVGIP